VLAILHRRAADSRPVVRKAAISALEAILLTAQSDSSSSNSLHHLLTPEDLQVFYDGCMDSSLAIRKQSLSSISRLYRSSGPTDLIMTRAWLGAVLPLTGDRELTVQEKALEVIDELILQPVLSAIK
jgi:hypothetical protein